MNKVKTQKNWQTRYTALLLVAFQRCENSKNTIKSIVNQIFPKKENVNATTIYLV